VKPLCIRATTRSAALCGVSGRVRIYSSFGRRSCTWHRVSKRAATSSLSRPWLLSPPHLVGRFV